MKRKIMGAITALALGGGLALVGVGTSASAGTPAPTVTMQWVTTNTSRPTSDTVNWPQTKYTGQCGAAWIQTDVYRNVTGQEKATVAKLAASATLNKGDDSSVVQSWTFTQEKPCVASASAIVITAATCNANGSATLGTVTNAKLNGALNEAPGTYSAVFTANVGSAFSGGSTFTESYTVPAKLTGTQCYTPPIATVCTSTSELPLATQTSPRGWGDLQNATWTKDGIQLTATSTQEAFAYVDSPDFASFKLSDIGNLSADATGDYAFIFQTANGNPWNIHHESDGTWWTGTAGLFADGSAGYYHASNLNNLLADPMITEVAVWVNPGHSALIKSVTFDCVTQPFGTETSTVVTTPPTTPPASTPNAPTAPNQIQTGDVSPLAPWYPVAIFGLIGAALVALRIRKTANK